MTRKQAYDQAVYRSRAPDDPDEEESVRLRELYALVLYGLGHDLEPPTFRAMAERQAHMRHQQEHLLVLLDSHAIEPHSYETQLKSVLKSWADDTRGLIGADNFRAIFGEGDPAGLLDGDAAPAH